MNKTEVVKTFLKAEKEYDIIELLFFIYGENIKVNMGFSKSTCETNIEDLAFSVRSYNALRRANITNVGKLIETINKDKLKEVKNLGAKCYKEIRTKILLFGYDHLSEGGKKEFFEYLVENNTPDL